MFGFFKKEKNKRLSVKEQEKLDNLNNPLSKEDKINLYKGKGKIRSYSCPIARTISYNSQDQYWATLDDYFFIMVDSWYTNTPGVNFDNIKNIIESTQADIGINLLDNLNHNRIKKEINFLLKSEERIKSFAKKLKDLNEN